MVFFAMSITRIFTIYVAQGLVCAFFIFLAYKILKRDRKRLNIIFAGFYIAPVIGFLVNFIYGPLTDETLVIGLNFITNFGIFYSPIFLVIFDLILLKSEKVINTTKQLAILIVYGAALFGMIFFVFVEGMGVEMALGDTGVAPDWSPHWMLPFFLYVVIIESVFAVGPSLYLSFQIYKKFEDEELKKKWKLFIYGFICLTIFMYGIFISNFLNDPTFRLIMGASGLILAILSGILCIPVLDAS